MDGRNVGPHTGLSPCDLRGKMLPTSTYLVWGHMVVHGMTRDCVAYRPTRIKVTDRNAIVDCQPQLTSSSETALLDWS